MGGPPAQWKCLVGLQNIYVNYIQASCFPHHLPGRTTYHSVEKGDKSAGTVKTSNNRAYVAAHLLSGYFIGAIKYLGAGNQTAL